MKIKLCNKRLNKTLTALYAAVTMLGLSTGSVLAHPDEKAAEKQQPPHQRPAPDHPAGTKSGSLAEAATNPIANLVQAQLQNSYNWENHDPSSGYSNTFVVQSVIPFKLPWEKAPLMITRTTLPYITTPDLDFGVGRHQGYGDLAILGLVTPKLKAKGIQIGIGATFVIPTAGDNEFTGSGKWQLGPSYLYINMRTPNLQWGVFAFQVWSIGNASGGSDREDVSKLSLQPFITKHLKNGWFIGSPESPQTYDFKANRWTWALGPQVGRVMKLGNQHVKMFGAIYYNPEDDAGPTPEWTFKFGLTYLFPK